METKGLSLRLTEIFFFFFKQVNRGIQKVLPLHAQGLIKFLTGSQGTFLLYSVWLTLPDKSKMDASFSRRHSEQKMNSVSPGLMPISFL